MPFILANSYWCVVQGKRSGHGVGDGKVGCPTVVFTDSTSPVRSKWKCFRPKQGLVLQLLRSSAIGQLG